ncbi:MAG: hypothetical protein ACI9OJ_005084 [Myxococcota bacterium]|jgi:hypothetical protein
MGRGQARKDFKEIQTLVNDEMSSVTRTLGGVVVKGTMSNHPNIPVDECKHVYKDLDEVIAVLTANGIARVASSCIAQPGSAASKLHKSCAVPPSSGAQVLRRHSQEFGVAHIGPRMQTHPGRAVISEQAPPIGIDGHSTGRPGRMISGQKPCGFCTPVMRIWRIRRPPPNESQQSKARVSSARGLLRSPTKFWKRARS